MASHRRVGLRNELGERLRDLRVASEVGSQERLAELAGVHRTYIGRLERGESGVTLEALAAILGAMDLSLATFFKTFDRPITPRTPRRRD